MRRHAALAAALVFALAVTSCSDDDSDRSGGPTTAARSGPVAGGTLHVGIERPATLDPAFVSPASQSEVLAADLLFDGLTAMGPSDRSAVPSLAASWESADAVTWRFTLQPGAAFANGRAITPADVKYSLERVARRGGASLAATRLEVIAGFAELTSSASPELAGVRAVDDRVVEIVTTGPFAELPELLSSPVFAVVPREAIEATDVSFAAEPVGSGPFSYADGSRERVSLVRSGSATALLERVELHLYDDLADAYDDFVADELDVTYVPPGRVGDAAQRFGTEAFTPFQAELFFGFNLANPKFADVRFRQAIVQAVDREALVRAVYPELASPLSSVVAAGVPGHVTDVCGAACSYDPDGARALVAAAFPAGGVPEVQVDYYEGAAEEAIAGTIESSLEAVGIPAARRPLPFEEYQQFAVSGQQELFRLGWLGVYPSPGAYLGPLFTSGGPDNVTSFADAAVDGLLAAARSSRAVDDRLARYTEAERAVLAAVPILPIAQFRTRAVVADRVQDLQFAVDGTFASPSVWLSGD